MPTTNNHEISLQDAIDMTTLYRANQPSGMPICETFDVNAIRKLLSVPGCSYLRIYYGMKEDNSIHAILVAADENNADILPPQNSLETNDNNPIIVDEGIRCPPACPPPSSLNT